MESCRLGQGKGGHVSDRFQGSRKFVAQSDVELGRETWPWDLARAVPSVSWGKAAPHS